MKNLTILIFFRWVQTTKQNSLAIVFVWMLILYGGSMTVMFSTDFSRRYECFFGKERTCSLNSAASAPFSEVDICFVYIYI